MGSSKRTVQSNPWGRTFNESETRAAIRLGLVPKRGTSPLYSVSPLSTNVIEGLEQEAEDLGIIAAAMRREWKKTELSNGQ